MHVRKVLDECEDDMAFFNQRIDDTVLERLTQMIEQPLRAHGVHARPSTSSRPAANPFEFPVEWGVDLASEHERYLCERHVGGPVVI
jgi:asparaginyl-tRNA synthetase